ncbi:MAG: DUF4403 family protein [Labilithrix sp.]|nr:DUF4403 family protein [Labilithrix sp.]
MGSLRAACLLVAAAACGGPRVPDTSPVPQTCAASLAPRASRVPWISTVRPFEAARSSVVVHVELPLANLRQTLEAKVPRRLAEERDHDIGVAGRLEYTVDRGPIAMRVEGEALVVESQVKVVARACAKGACYAGCEPEALATARVPLRLGADYKFRPSEVRFDVTRGCAVRAIGGFVTVDVTPVLRSRLALEAPRVQAAIDRELPDMRPQALRLWAELGKPRPLAFGACMVLAPEEITQGPASGTSELARLRFGLLARPELQLRCAEAGPYPRRARALPPLRDDPALPEAGDVHLAVIFPPEAPGRALEGAPEALDLGRGRARVQRASGDTTSGLDLDLRGEACGPVAVSASGAAWSEGGVSAVHLTGVATLPGETERLAAAGLDAASFVKGVERAPLNLPIAVDQLPTLLPELARGLSDDTVTVAANVIESKPESAGVRGAEIVAAVALRGAVLLRAK